MFRLKLKSNSKLESKPALNVGAVDLHPTSCSSYETGPYDFAHFLEMQAQGAVDTQLVLIKYKNICTHAFLGLDQNGNLMVNKNHKLAAPCPPYCPTGTIDTDGNK